ncbi:MAG: transposase [Armatimonadetes bacterium]|nr:transposase [Armatimonadota bacterium]
MDNGPQELLVTMLRPGNVDAAAHAVALLQRLVPRLRQACPKAQFLFRADGGFARPEIYAWCENSAHRVDYEIDLSRNSVLAQLAAPYLEDVHAIHAETDQWQRRFAEACYQAQEWPQPRRVVIKAEVTVKDNGDTRDNPRFVVTNLSVGQAQAIYEHYGDRGEMENRISPSLTPLFLWWGVPRLESGAGGGVPAELGLHTHSSPSSPAAFSNACRRSFSLGRQ